MPNSKTKIIGAQCESVHAESVGTPLISRANLFANPVRTGISISPDGQWLAWLANDNGVMNIWAAPRENLVAARQLTFDRHRGISGFSWSYVPGLLMFSQDRDGDENWRLYGVDISTKQLRELAPVNPGARISVFARSRNYRSDILVNINERNPSYPDIYRLDLNSGKMTLVEENPGFSAYLADDDYCIRLAIRNTSDGGRELLRRDADGFWKIWIHLSPEDANCSGPTHFSRDGRILYFRDSRGRDTAALTAFDLVNETWITLAEDSRADIGGTINDHHDYRPLAYAVTYEKYQLHVLDDAIRQDVEYLDNQGIGEWRLAGRTEDDQLWLIAASSDIRPSASYLYNRKDFTLIKLLEVRPHLANARLSRMQSVVIKARDGLNLVSYLTVPAETDAGDLYTTGKLPLVMLVHGGPWDRDSFGYNSMHQWLANRGYAVLSVNFRASTGFGKAFLDAGNGEWGRKMDEDLEDAVEWAIGRGIADPARLAIFGGSYGGYAVLSALTRYPERYACGIDVVGPSNLESLLASIPPYWDALRAMQYRAIGNPETEDGLALLRDRSPIYRAAAIRVPLLIAQGANDPRVKQVESEQMVTALRENGISVTYALYPDEGHGFVREANRMSFNALVEEFLSRHLGGRVEPWNTEDYPGSSLRIMMDGI
ncbi:TPA: S9 family peptidase [Klebsiella michiganensis]|nr:S9 family peptidase [Klebsiella michiganensis]